MVGSSVMRLEPCGYTSLKQFEAEAKRTSVLTYDRKRAMYWLVMNGDQPAGYCGLLSVGRGKVRLISCLIAESMRGRGLGLFATQERIRIAVDDLSADLLQVQTVRPEFFASLGFVVAKEYKCCTGMVLQCR